LCLRCVVVLCAACERLCGSHVVCCNVSAECNSNGSKDGNRNCREADGGGVTKLVAERPQTSNFPVRAPRAELLPSSLFTRLDWVRST
jgi:hypothetical protein